MAVQSELFFLHLLQFPRRYESVMMASLKARGHSDLRLSYAPVMSALALGDMRLTRLAESLGMQKQNCLQLLKRIEEAGYIRRVADPGDKRSRLVQLTDAGRRLIKDGAGEVRRIDAGFENAVGAPAFARFRQNLDSLCAGLPCDAPPGGMLLGQVSKLAAYAGRQLNTLVRGRGHPRIRPVHEKVLLHVGEGRVRIHDIALANDVSRQAISSIVNELQDFGYIALDVDALDRRGKVIRLTGQGRDLVQGSMEATRELLQSFQHVVGKQAMQQLQQTLAELYGLLDSDTTDTPAEAPEVLAGQSVNTLARSLALRLRGDDAGLAESILGPDDASQLLSLLSRLHSPAAE